jgi:hypothetical protein
MKPNTWIAEYSESLVGEIVSDLAGALRRRTLIDRDTFLNALDFVDDDHLNALADTIEVIAQELVDASE